MKPNIEQAKTEDPNMSEALEAVQRMVLQMESEETTGPVAEAQERQGCRSCGAPNPSGNRFCARCGVPLQDGQDVARGLTGTREPAAAGQHFYHHHYHHHFFESAEGSSTAASAGVTPIGRGKPAAPSASGGTRAESAVRKLGQDWVVACNMKRIEDLVDLYAADAMVVRPNLPPIRTAAAIREYFVTALEAGLGDVELEPLRVELLGDFAYEVGRCSMLVPGALGKRREERGKYVLVSARQAGEWKILLDTWSTDLSLSTGGEIKAQIPGVVPRPAKSA